MKLKDCDECQRTIGLWSLHLNSPWLATRRMAKRQIKLRKRDHSKLRRHDFPWKSIGNTYVSGCYKKKLIHNGGK